MAVINDPTTAANIGRVGMASGMVWTPQHNAPGPIPVGSGGAFRISIPSPAISAGLGGNQEVIQFRYVTGASRVCLVHGVSISAQVITLPAVSTTAIQGPLALVLRVARNWTVAGSAGTRMTMTGNNQKLRTGHATSEVNDIGVCAAGAGLTVGTKTLDSQDIGGVQLIPPGVLTAVGAALGSLCPKTNLLGEHFAGLAFPLVLGNQEGFVVRTGAGTMPLTMTWAFTCDIAWSEVDGF